MCWNGKSLWDFFDKLSYLVKFHRYDSSFLCIVMRLTFDISPVLLYNMSRNQIRRNPYES